MKEKRMLEAVQPKSHPLLGWFYAFAAILLVIIMLKVGVYIGEIVVWSGLMLLPSDIMQVLMFTIDPIFINLLIFIFPFIFVCLWVLSVEHRSPVGLGLFKKKACLELLKGWLIGSVLIGAVVGLQLVTGSIQVFQLHFSGENILSFILILPFWLVQAGTEELLTRGWLFPVITRNTRLWVGMAVSSLLFAVLHLQNPSINGISMLNIGLFGLLACLYVLKTDNIWGISAIHAAWNSLQGSFFGLNVSGLPVAYSPISFTIENVPEYMSGGHFGPEASVFSTLVLGSYILYLVWSFIKKNEPPALLSETTRMSSFKQR